MVTMMAFTKSALFFSWSGSTLAFFGGRRGFLSQGLDQLSKPNILFGDIKNNYDRKSYMQTLETHGLQWGGIAKSLRLN